MKIAIIGAGAMGCLYGAFLSRDLQNSVYLIDIWKEHMDAIHESGLQMETNGQWETFDRLHASIDSSSAGIVDLAIIFVKSTMTEAAIRANRSIFGSDTVALTLQNGLGNVEQMQRVVGDQNIIAGTTAHGATMLGPGKMRHAGWGKTIIGELSGITTDRLNKIAGAFRNAGLETDLSSNVMGLIWDKLVINVGINALTGITRLPNGKLLDHSELTQLMDAAVKEAHAVAEKKGIQLSFDPVSHTREVCAHTAANRSSMLQDILNHRKTEIEMINGAIVSEGINLGIETPVNSTLVNLIRFFEKEQD